MNINEKISKDGDQGAEKSHYHLQGPSKNKEIKPGMEGRTSHRIDPVWEMPWTVGTLPNIVEGLSRETGHQSRERWSSWEHTIQRQWEGKSIGSSVALQSIGIIGQCKVSCCCQPPWWSMTGSHSVTCVSWSGFGALGLTPWLSTSTWTHNSRVWDNGLHRVEVTLKVYLPGCTSYRHSWQPLHKNHYKLNRNHSHYLPLELKNKTMLCVAASLPFPAVTTSWPLSPGYPATLSVSSSPVSNPPRLDLKYQSISVLGPVPIATQRS